MNTSVLMLLGSVPGAFQKEPVSLSKMLTLTSQSSLAKARLTLLALAPLQAGFWPHAKKPFMVPSYIWSNRFSHEQFWPSSGLGSHAYPKSFSLVALSPQNDLSRLTEYLGKCCNQLTLRGSTVFG